MRSGRLPVGGAARVQAESRRVRQLEPAGLTSVPGVTLLFSASV
jgi:hypothetical protein